MFNLTEDQVMIQKMVREFAEERIAPTVLGRDDKHVFDRKIVDEIGQMGLAGLYFPEEYCGAGTDYLTISWPSKSCQRWTTVWNALSANVSLCANPIFDFGTEEQRRKYLTQLASRGKIGAFGLTEPGAGTDARTADDLRFLRAITICLTARRYLLPMAARRKSTLFSR